MDAEALYDSILKVTGRLDPTPFGPAEPLETKPSKEVVAKGSKAGFRRSIYTQQRRYDPVSLLEAYDLPRMTPNCVEAQELYRGHPGPAHDERFGRVEHSRYMAGRIIDPGGYDRKSQIVQAYLQALSREPTEWELGRSQAARAVRPPMEVPAFATTGSDPRPLGRPVAGPGQSVSYFVEFGRVQLRGLRSLCYTSPLETRTPV